MRVAIVGAGVSGLVAAHALHEEHDVTIYDSAVRPGGHVHTWNFELAGRSWAIDSGFIVYNELNYPAFTALLKTLGVSTQPSEMSFSVRSDADALEYNGTSLSGLFTQRRNLVRPKFLGMLRDVLRFNRDGPRHASESDPELTIGELIDREGYGTAFQRWYLLPMGSAIWSLPTAEVRSMPAGFFLSFFANHGMLTIDDRPQWRVIEGGSSTYVDALTRPFRDRLRLGTKVGEVNRLENGVVIDGTVFDRVIFACHSDQALAALSDPTDAERAVLGAIPYQINTATVHTDVGTLPKRGKAWAAWNYRVGDSPESPATVTYNMNILQSLKAPETFCVTLNSPGLIDPTRVLGEVEYAHPVFTTAGIIARGRRAEISGVNRTHFCGAYWGNGFHEDGVVSGLAAAAEINRPTVEVVA